jgi:ornithine cyclodeaminase
LLVNQEEKIVQAVAEAYQIHARQNTSVPHSTFLLFPQAPANRIIGLPAYLGESFEVAGMKWIASFPGNTKQGIERASAVLILNSTENGRAIAIMESSIISARRTAASAALAARCLRQDTLPDSAALVGCGLINFEILRFLMAVLPQLKTIFIYDLDPQRARQFYAKCVDAFPLLRIVIGNQLKEVTSETNLVAFATTAGKPYIHDARQFTPGSVLLHVSLRDLAPDIILSANNIVDDIDHVCRAQTSLHLAEQATGNRSFIHGTIGEVLGNQKPLPDARNGLTIFSPFGLGILDLAVAHFAYHLAKEKNSGQMVYNFLPTNWVER